MEPLTPQQFERYGFTLSEERIGEVTNHISEGESDCYTKKEAAEAVRYWSLAHYHAISTLQSERTNRLIDSVQKLNDDLMRITKS